MKRNLTPRGSPPPADQSTRFAIGDIASASMSKATEAVAATQGEYRAYIASPAWLENPARLAELIASGGRCRLCDRGPPRVRLEVHHRTYRNLFREQPSDLTTLCATCHEGTTRMLRYRVSAFKPADSI